MQFLIYSAALAGYVFTEYYFKFRYKTRTTNKQFDITLYLITVPFTIMAIIPVWFLINMGYEPDLLSLVSFLFIFTLGTTIRGIGRYEIGSLFSGKVELNKEHVVVNTGIYRYLRHPLYLGSSLMTIGIVLYCVNMLSILLLGIFAIGIMSRIEKEEKYLKANLHGYLDYAKTSKRLIPYIY